MVSTMQNTFSHTSILKIFPRVKARSMISWTERGLIEPLQNAIGRGSSRVYSYTNLIEIAIISELLQYRIPFTNILLAMRSDEMENLLKKKLWDTIFWISNGVTLSRHIPLISFGVTPIDKFLDKGGELIMGAKGIAIYGESRSIVLGKTDPITFKSSAIVINVSTLKRYVDSMIKKL
jgi:hypothetical protein